MAAGQSRGEPASHGADPIGKPEAAPHAAMARARRSYTRDSRGRFASTPGGGKKAPSGLPKRSPRKAGTPPPKRRGLVTQRAAVKRASAKLKGLDTSGSYSGALKQRAQKGAVTRAANRLKAAEQRGRIRIKDSNSVAGGRRSGIIAKPRLAQPQTAKAKTKPARPKRTAEEQARRDLIATGLRKLPKEKRARAIAMRREMEGRTAAPGEPKPRMTLKERWLNRANVSERAAQRNMERVAEIERRHAPYRGDIAFNTQPGRIPQRERMIREQDRAFELRKKAREQLQRAQELRNLATTNKGDAERKRQAERDAVTVEKGSRISTIMYGPGVVVRVNKKTVSYQIGQTGFVVKVDKSWVQGI